jgi:hypothetical protein
MDALAFRAALRASAKVALGVAAGCGGAISTASDGPPPTTADASVGHDATDAVEAAVAFDAAIAFDSGVGPVDVSVANACNPPPASSLLPEQLDAGVVITDSTFDCCASWLSTVAGVDSGVGFSDAAAADPDVTACCAVVVVRLDGDRGAWLADPDAGHAALDRDFALAAPVRWSCCVETGFPGGPTCAPWGPPMPPAMPASAAGPVHVARAHSSPPSSSREVA